MNKQLVVDIVDLCRAHAQGPAEAATALTAAIHYIHFMERKEGQTIDSLCVMVTDALLAFERASVKGVTLQ